ncbi:MAG: hypothetical protein AAGD25_25185 [Cyanobacteria bacterium P01_F01_bin.150]
MQINEVKETMNIAATELSDAQYIEMFGEERLKEIQEFSEDSLPVLDYDLMGDNFFIAFKDRKDVEALISDLADLLASNTKNLNVRAPGRLTTIGELEQ